METEKQTPWEQKYRTLECGCTVVRKCTAHDHDGTLEAKLAEALRRIFRWHQVSCKCEAHVDARELLAAYDRKVQP